VGNGFAFDPDAWGANAGISLSSSENCFVERNLIVGNKEGISLREQKRSTRRLGSRTSEEIWNKGHIVRNNVLAYNQDAQVWGWFDIDDERHWPESMQRQLQIEDAEVDSDTSERRKRLSLEDLKLAFENNLYCPGAGQGLFIWGTKWKRSQNFDSLDEVQKILGLEKGSFIGEFKASNISGLDFSIRPNSVAITQGCYPKGTVPGVTLGSSE
jgi:parallel beta-helix repeat protein